VRERESTKKREREAAVVREWE